MAFDKVEIKQLKDLFRENNKAIGEAMSKGFETIEQQIGEARTDIVNLTKRVGGLEGQVGGLTGRIEDLEQDVKIGFARIDDSLDRKNRKGYNHEQRLIKLEKIHPRGKHVTPVSS
ncbi:MAG: hypothetical protein HY376_03770 [Candidatus Blackburnbacteria bacterium]|nr:hypothetical protein [Candidatus Blackburnbacteria bacterium]